MNQSLFRLITGLLLCALGLGQPRLYAEETPNNTVVDLQLTIGSASVAKAGEVCIPVRVNNFTSILGMEFTMTYDTNVLEYKSVKNFNLVGLSETSSFGLPGIGINPKGTLKVSWLDPNVSGVTVANGTAIFEVCFTAKNVDATTSVAFGASSEILNANEETVNLAGTAGTITVGAGGSSGGGGTGGGGTGGGTGGGSTGGGTVGTGTFAFVVSDTSVAVNRPFCLKVKSGSFKDILGIGLTMNYTAAALRFDSVAKFNLNGLNAATFGLPGVGINPLGAIKLSWTDPNVTGISVVDSTVLFELCFTAIQNDVTTSVTFAANPEIINKDEAEVAFSGNSGVVVIGTGAGSGGGTGGGGSVGTGTFTLAISDTTVAVNRPFCLKVKSGSFKDILGIGLTMNYTAAALRFDSVAKFNLDGLNAATFGLPGVGVNPLGSIKLSWTDPNVTGISVVDSTVLFELCFTAIQNDVTTSVTFAANPEIINKDEAEVAFSGNPGVVVIGTGAGSGGGTGGGGSVGTGTFTLAISDTTVAVNRPFCLKVKSGSFKDILGVETTMNYTAAALRFDSVAKFNLTGLNESSFGLPGVGVNPLGSIKLSWTDPNVTGMSVVDSTTLFELCFTSIQNNVTTNVTFASNPEIINKAEAIVPFSGNPGVVVIGTGAGGGSAGTGPFTLDITDATVGGGGEVCLPVVATNFSNILGMEFSITYDPAKLQFKSVIDMNLSGLTAEGNFGFPGVGTVPAGTLKVSWNDPEVVGKTVVDGTALFKVCFTAIGSNTTAVVGFSSTSEIIKGDASIVPMTASSGTVTISGVSNSNLSLVISSAPVQPGQEVCLDVRVGKFKDIIGLEFTIGYDSTKLRFNQVTGFGALRGLDGSAFGLPGVGTNKKGSIKVAWVDPEVSGVTLADSVSIFRVCFTATGTAGTTTNVSLNQPIEITNTNGQHVTSNQIAGEVAIGGSSANNGRLQLILSDAAVSRNTNVCLDMAVQNFNSIVGMEFTIKYNPDSLTFKSIQNLNLSGLEQSSFNALALGSIKLSWYDPQVAGITLPGMVNIFQVCFTTKSLLGITQVQVDPLQTIEITDVNDQAVPRDFNNGIINVLANELPPLVIAIPAQITNVTCLGVNTGAINITVQGGSGNYTYRWSYQNATTQDLSNLPPGTYTVTVTDATTQISAMQTYTVTGPSSALQVSVVPQQIACFGANDGQLTATVSGGTPAYTYAWSGSLPAIANPTNIAPGSYTLTVTDASGCRVTSAAIAITQPDSALVLTVNAQNATCIGINNGQITASVRGGVKPYTYTWSNNLPALTSHSNLAVGPYRVTVTDARGCVVSGSGQVGQSAGVNITSVQSNPIDAGSDGAVNVTVAGGQLPYVFTWTGPGGFSRSTEDISNLNTIGSYCFRVDDSKGCFDTTCVLILKKLKFDSISVQEACYETANGGISIKMTGGQTPYQYLWSNGSNAQVLSGVKAGSYGITVTDATGTTLSGNFEIPEVDAIAISGKIEPARGKEGVANGSIQLTVSGGAGAYTYKWNVGSTSASLTGLAKGEYCVTVTDGKNCSVSRCFQIDLVSLPLAVQTEVTNNRCFGQAKGAIRIQVTGGLEPYFALFNDGVRIDATSQGVIERANLAAGTYTYVITDREGTTIANSSIVTQATAIALTQTVVKHDNDQPGCTGTISVSIAGGAGSYNVRWNSNNAGSLITNLCEGKYVPTVEDANGCSVVFDPIDVNTFTFLGQIVDNVCPGDAGGDVNLTVAGGAAPYTYFWLNSKGDTISRTKDLSNVLSGAYRVIVKESSGNSLLKEFSIGTRSSLSARALVTSNYRTYGVSCTDAADGVVEATAINGIGTNYIYAWLLNDNLVGSQQRLTKAQAGMYKLQVTDEAGCMAEAEVQLTAPPILGISGSVNHISCVGARDGDILVSASGGVPGSIYTYRWSTGATGPRISFLTKGNYVASVTDANNCTDTASFTVLEPLPMSASVEVTPATTPAPDCNGAARVTVTGGTRPFAYITNVPGAKTTDSVFLKLCAGDYALEIVDSRGCKTNPQRLSFTILDRTLPCLDTRTIITPDGDGANETLEIRCIEELKDNRLFIFSEWGQKVYESQNYSNDWKGTTQGGEELPEGAYFYVLEYTDIDGNRIQVKGSIALIRQ